MEFWCNFHFMLVYAFKFMAFQQFWVLKVSDFSLHVTFAVSWHRTVVLNQRDMFLTRGAAEWFWTSINELSGVVSPYVPCNMKSLINKFTNICLHNLFDIMGPWNKEQLLNTFAARLIQPVCAKIRLFAYALCGHNSGTECDRGLFKPS